MQSNSYTIKEDDTEPIEGSGTRIVLHLKEDSEEYLDDFKVKNLIQTFTTFDYFQHSRREQKEAVPCALSS